MSNPFFSKARQVAELTMIPFYLVGGPLVGFWIGGWIDQRFATTPHFKTIFVILGAISGMRESWRAVSQMSKEQ